MNSLSGLMSERDQLLEEIRTLKLGGQLPAIEGNGNETRYLKTKVYHFEKLVERLENEKSQLQIQCTMAKEHQKLLEQQLEEREKTHVRELITLKNQLKRVLIN